MNNQEQIKSRLENQDFIAKIREQLASEWEEEVTKPQDPKYQGKYYSQEEIDWVEKIRAGEKIPGLQDGIEYKLIRIAQEQRLTPDEIDQLKKIFFVEKEN